MSDRLAPWARRLEAIRADEVAARRLDRGVFALRSASRRCPGAKSDSG